jgi:hypothetical protein
LSAKKSWIAKVTSQTLEKTESIFRPNWSPLQNRHNALQQRQAA